MALMEQKSLGVHAALEDLTHVQGVDTVRIEVRGFASKEARGQT